MVWTVFWMGLLTVQGLAGDIWTYLNPFTAPAWLARSGLGWRAPLCLPAWLGYWPALAGFLLFGFVLLADPAPADPDHLARLAAGYWVFHFALALLYGPAWLRRGEPFAVLFRAIGWVGICARSGGRLRLGPPGWQIATGAAPPLSLAVFCVMVLATGSFDGLNETFWWLGVLGMNPLEFSGRSAVVWQNTAGLLLANLFLVLVFALTLTLGQRLAGQGPHLTRGMRLFAPTLLPIALGYHVAHYLPSFLVDSQYALVALSDPLMSGADWLRLGEFFVSTGFFNSKDSVRVIYLSQAGAVVAGHVLAVLTAHAVALKAYGSHREAVLSQVPLAVFMLGYTWFGLWLLASPRF
ncbi:hypothetical protein [Candidatus Rhodobacter oscarellae]|nr:hypothetical protein [Candidatus Rhodobacter lobularis]